MIHGADAFFYLKEGQVVLAIHQFNGKPLFIIDLRKCNIPVLIEKDSQATYLIEDGVIKGQKEAQDILVKLTKI